MPPWKIAIARDEPRAALVRDVGPSPLNHHHQAVAKSYQKQDVNEEPRHPSRKTRKLEPAEICNSGGASDSRHAAFVVVVERFGGLALDRAQNVLRRCDSLLPGDWSDARQGCSLRIDHGS